MCELGQGTGRDIDTAYDCYLQAAHAGVKEAQDKLATQKLDWENSTIGSFVYLKPVTSKSSYPLINFNIATEIAKEILVAEDAKATKKKRQQDKTEKMRRLSLPNYTTDTTWSNAILKDGSHE